MNTLPALIVAAAIAVSSSSQSVDREQERMKEMRQQVHEMELLMRQIEIENDPQRRSELLRQHKQALREGMDMLSDPMRGEDIARDDMLNQSMEERMQTLQNRMETRQQILEQMIEQNTAQP